MKCPKCQRENESDRRFCIFCGSLLHVGFWRKNNWQIIGLAIVTTMVLVGVTLPPQQPKLPTPRPAPGFATTPAPDKKLEAAIRNALGKPLGEVITAADLANLTELHLGNSGISDISPLASLTNLEMLYLGTNQISDISPLASLTNLTLLYLSENQISDISPLGPLTNLEMLYLQDNQISDISPLASLTNLKVLELMSNPISDTSINTYIPQLIERGVEVSWGTPPETVITFPDANLEAVIRGAINKPQSSIYKSDLKALTKLRAQEIGISDLTGLEYCVNLEVLQLWDNNISDLSPLAGLTTNLWFLELQGNNISDLSPLAGLTNLDRLHLGGNNISDISALASLTNLRHVLSLGDNNISDLSPLAGLTNLRVLGLGDNNISDISPLASLTSLTHLNLRRNQISDISPLVENSGLGEGDEVWLQDNNLDLSEGSEDLENIRQLEGRGVTVQY